jgi:hypothetical protein
MTPPGIEPATFRFVAQYLNHCATGVELCMYCIQLHNTENTSQCGDVLLGVLTFTSHLREEISWYGIYEPSSEEKMWM